MKILLISKDNTLLEVLQEQLAYIGYVQKSNVTQLDLNMDEAQLILLDSSFSKEIADISFPCPVFILGEAEGLDGIKAPQKLSFPKPLRIAQLLTSIKNVPSYPVKKPEDFSFAQFVFNVSLKELYDVDMDTVIRLTDVEVSILSYLAQNIGKPVHRDALLKEVLGYHPEATTHTVATHIYRLRQKIEADSANPQILLTDEAGYKLVG